MTLKPYFNIHQPMWNHGRTRQLNRPQTVVPRFYEERTQKVVTHLLLLSCRCQSLIERPVCLFATISWKNARCTIMKLGLKCLWITQPFLQVKLNMTWVTKIQFLIFFAIPSNFPKQWLQFNKLRTSRSLNLH